MRVRAIAGIGFGARRARVNGEDVPFDEQGALLHLRKGDNIGGLRFTAFAFVDDGRKRQEVVGRGL